jgi:ornithine decarboxylase
MASVAKSSDKVCQGLEAAHMADGCQSPAAADIMSLESSYAGEDDVRMAAFSALQSLGSSTDEPIQLVNLGQVRGQVELWNRLLPQVQPHYAMKCNPDKRILQELWCSGCGFDCATQAEIQSVLSLGVDPDDIVYSHPCKPRGHIRFARSVGVSKMSFDNTAELQKIHSEFPDAKLLLRLVCEDATAQCPMSSKFGASKKVWFALLDLVVQLKLDLVGVSFHVGSGCRDPESFERALMDAKEIFKMANERGIHLTLLDIGGGFPGDADTFSYLAPMIAEKLNLLFPSYEHEDLKVIAEPGRFFASRSCHLLTKVHAKAKLEGPDGEHVCRYYINDGLYGSFNCIIFDHVTVVPEPLHETPPSVADLKCTIFGPTCDGFDVIMSNYVMRELDEGDWLLWRNMGAYTSAAGSLFNGFPLATPWYYHLKGPLTFYESLDMKHGHHSPRSFCSSTASTDFCADVLGQL